MSDEPQSPNPTDAGQAATAPWSQGTSQAAPDPQGGQAQAPQGQDAGQAPQQGTQPTDEPSFFDVNNVPPELMPAYKQMQAAFTVKTQGLSREKQKIEAYDAFMRDPVGQMQQLASQYGLHLTRAQAAQEIQNQQQQKQDWQPQTWNEVTETIKSEAKREAKEEIMREMAPYLGQMQQIRASSVEQQLSSIDPNWKEYEGNMREMLQKHPTLVNDVADLYRMSVPKELLEANAIQTALKKFEDKAQHQKVTSGGTAPRSKPAGPQIKTFEDAVQAAKRELNS